jgi:hypothetical protein
MSKVTQLDIVKELLRTYQDVTGTLNGAGDWQSGKPGSRVLYRDPFKSPYYAGSYRELESILRHMSAGGGLEGEPGTSSRSGRGPSRSRTCCASVGWLSER